MDREGLRARVYLRSVLPLVERLARPGWRGDGVVQIEAEGEGAALVWKEGRFFVEQGVRAGAEVRWRFRDRRAMNRFFSTGRGLPRIVGWRYPGLMVRAVRLLASLRILQPGRAPKRVEERALRVKLVLALITRAMAELYRGGHEELRELVDGGPERVYQWTVEKSGIGAYLRMAPGRVKAGRGTYEKRRPFVQFMFADVDAAFRVLTATGSQMEGVRSGALITIGSPEYTRKIALIMQRIDELLRVG